MSVIDTLQLLELRTKKAASLIAILRKDKVNLQQQLAEAQSRPVADPAVQEKLDEALARVSDFQAKVDEGDATITQLRQQLAEGDKNLAELLAKYDLVNNHNAELEEYVEKFQTSNKLIEESVAKAMENLDQVEGLDDTPLDIDIADDLSAADDFTSGGALTGEQVDDGDLL